jgi:hypothetical protein
MVGTRVAGVVAALVVAAVLGPAGVASAQTETLKDGTGDVWQNFYDVPTGEASYEPAGSPPNTDLTRLTITHERKLLTVKAKWAELVADNDVKTGIEAFLRLANGDDALLVFHINDDWHHPYVGLRLLPHETPGKGHWVRDCSGLAATINLKRDTMTATVPTTCLGKPRWVQVHALAGSGSEDENGQAATSYQDSAHSDGYDDYWLTVTDGCFTECEGWTGKIRRTR